MYYKQSVRFQEKRNVVIEKNALLKSSSVFKHFENHLANPIKFLLTDTDWEELVRHLEEVIPAFENLLS